MAGITRIVITNEIKGRGAHRFEQCVLRQPYANDLYLKIFNYIGCPLENGYDEIRCDINDLHAAYDRLLGVDVLLRFANGMTATLQEKFLFTNYDTVTLEKYNDPKRGIEGDWFHLKAQYYFVGYDRIKDYTLQDWILLDWGSIQRLTNQNEIRWRYQTNNSHGAVADFQYINVHVLPDKCVILKKWRNQR